MGIQPKSELIDLVDVVESRIDLLLQHGLLEQKQEWYYKTTRLGKALVRHGLNLADHLILLENFNKHEEFIKQRLGDLNAIFERYLAAVDHYRTVNIFNFIDKRQDALNLLIKDLYKICEETGRSKFFSPNDITPILIPFKNIYLKLMFDEEESEFELERKMEQVLIKTCKDAILA